jgi:3-oxoacyl-[acyl-carrier-protein] synthase II
MTRPIVVTGIGMVSPLGLGKSEFATSLFSGRCGIGPLTLFDCGESGSRLAAQVNGFRAQDFIRPATVRRMDRLSQLVAAAARMAGEDAGLPITADNRDRIGVILGTCFGGTDVAATFGKVLFTEGPRRVNPILVPNTVMNAPAGHLAIELGVRGINTTVNHREVAVETALAYAAAELRGGRAEAIFSGGGDILSPFAVKVLSHFRALSPQDGGVEGAYPFDSRANGLVLGEGASVLCLETEESARQRGVQPYCEIVAWGMAAAPATPTGWPESPEGVILAIKRALAAADISAADIDVVCASAAGAPALDRLEATALTHVFGKHRPYIVALKGALGEGLSSGAIRAATMALALRQQQLAPIVGLSEPIADLNFVRPGHQNIARLRYGLINGIAAGGTFVTLIFKTWEAAEWS